MTAQLPIATEVIPMVLKFHPVISMTDEQLFDFCQLNKNFRIERKANGEIIIASPTNSENDQRNFELIGQLGIWKKQDGTGVGFGSSGGFTLPNGAVRSPDAAWIKKTDWEAIPLDKRKEYFVAAYAGFASIAAANAVLYDIALDTFGIPEIEVDCDQSLLFMHQYHIVEVLYGKKVWEMI